MEAKIDGMEVIQYFLMNDAPKMNFEVDGELMLSPDYGIFTLDVLNSSQSEVEFSVWNDGDRLCTITVRPEDVPSEIILAFDRASKESYQERQKPVYTNDDWVPEDGYDDEDDE